MNVTSEVQKEFKNLIERAYLVSTDVGQEVEDILALGTSQPLDRDEAVRLLTKVILALKRTPAGAIGLEGDVSQIVEDMIATRQRWADSGSTAPVQTKKTISLISHNGTDPKPVDPTPYFQGKAVPMLCGFVRTPDIELWDNNARLEIHVEQFRNEQGREPSPDELLDIMLSRMPLKGIPEAGKDQFRIVELAQSIATNGVRRPPILTQDGTLLDGNRRVAACYYILHSNEFTYEQKQKAEKIFVWQLTEHATRDDAHSVEVSLNFEPDHKLDWPEYVKAKRLSEDWQMMLAVEPRSPGPQRAAEMKRELSLKYALGPDTAHVNRYLRMMEWADEFKDHHIEQNSRDTFEVEHHTERYFQYFDELSKGTSAGGVAHTLNQDDGYKHLTFDLLYDGKFKNWNSIRNLKYDDEDVREKLAQARAMDDLEEAQDLVEDALTDAKNRRRQYRVVGANTRIKEFVRWLENLPLSAFRDELNSENLNSLLRALKLVEAQVMLVEEEGRQA